MLRSHRRIVDVVAGVILGLALASIVHVTPEPIAQQPFPDAAEYADSAQRLADDQGYVTLVHGPVAQPPRYPPGLPLVLAPFARFGTYASDVQRGATALALRYVLAVVGAAWALGGSLAAVIAGLVVLISPFARENAKYVLSDAFAASLFVLMLPILRWRTTAGERLGGALMGLAALVRLTSGVGIIATLAASPRASLKRILLWSVPFLVGLGLLQWVMYGSPFYTGYDYWGLGLRQTFNIANVFGSGTGREGAAIFTDLLNGHAMNFICPCRAGGSIATLSNFWFYPALLAGGFWVYAPPLLPLLGLWWAWRHRREAVGRYALVVILATVVVFDLYNVQASRFMAGPASLLVVLAAVALAEGAYALSDKWSPAA